MSKFISKKLNLIKIKNLYTSTTIRRTILSPAYQCNDEWNKRLDNPLIKNIELDTFFYQLNEKLIKKTSIVPTDVDLFLNKASNKNLNEVINIVQRFRKNWRSRGILESSHHAFIKIFLENDNSLDRLVDILSKRVEFGIFPDKFCYNLLLDKLISLNKYEQAVKIAVLRMLQEDFSSLIGNYLSLKSCNLYLKENKIKAELFIDPKPEDEEEKSTEASTNEDDEEEEEIEYIRIPYLRNKFFDDHFDIKDTYSLIGKTFYLNGYALKDANKELSDNSIIYGLCLYKKWDKALDYLNNNNDFNRCKDLIELIDTFISKIQVNETDDNKIKKLQANLKSLNKESNKTFEELIDENYKLINKLEQDEIDELIDNYKKFNEIREQKLKNDLDELLKLEIIEQIKERKKELEDRKRRLYFFENHEEYKLLEHEAMIKIKKAEESMRIEEEYIPPKVR